MRIAEASSLTHLLERVARLFDAGAALLGRATMLELLG
jgi:hypothetical protein